MAGQEVGAENSWDRERHWKEERESLFVQETHEETDVTTSLESRASHVAGQAGWSGSLRLASRKSVQLRPEV